MWRKLKHISLTKRSESKKKTKTTNYILNASNNMTFRIRHNYRDSEKDE